MKPNTIASASDGQLRYMMPPPRIARGGWKGGALQVGGGRASRVGDWPGVAATLAVCAQGRGSAGSRPCTFGEDRSASNVAGTLIVVLALALILLLTSASTASAATLTGKVSEPSKENASTLVGVSAAQVTAENAGTQEQVASAASELDGSYSMELPEGSYDLMVSPPLGSPFRTVVDRNEHLGSAGRQVDVVLVSQPETVPVSPTWEEGRHYYSGALRSASGEPIAGATVELTNSTCPGEYGCIGYAMTNARGEFSVWHSAVTGNANVIVSGSLPEGGAGFSYRSTGEPVRLSAGFHEDLTVPRAYRLTLEPRDRQGTPIRMSATGGLSCPNVSVAPGFTGTGYVSQGATGTAITMYHFACPGAQSVELAAPGVASVTASVAATAADTTQSVTDVTNTLSGVLYGRSSTPLSGASVSAGSQSTTTASDGSFSLPVPPGAFSITVSGTRPSGVPSSAAPQSYSVRAQATVAEDTQIALTLPVGEAGYRPTFGGKPVPGLMMSASGSGAPSGGRYLAPGIQIASASFSTGELEANSEGKAAAAVISGLASAVQTQYAESHTEYARIFTPTKVTLAAGTEAFTVESYYANGGGDAGTVEYTTGEPIPGVTVRGCVEASYGQYPCVQDTSNALGEYALVTATNGCSGRETFSAEYGGFQIEGAPLDGRRCAERLHAPLIFPQPTSATIELREGGKPVPGRKVPLECSDSYSAGAVGGTPLLSTRGSFSATLLTDAQGRGTIPSYEGTVSCDAASDLASARVQVAPEPAVNIWEIPVYDDHLTLQTTSGHPVVGERLLFCGERYYRCESGGETAATTGGDGSIDIHTNYEPLYLQSSTGGAIAGHGAGLGMEAEGIKLTAGTTNWVVSDPPEEQPWTIEAQDTKGATDPAAIYWGGSWAPATLTHEEGGTKVTQNDGVEWGTSESQPSGASEGALSRLIVPGAPESTYVSTKFWSGYPPEARPRPGKLVVAATAEAGAVPPPPSPPTVTSVTVEGAGRYYITLSVTGESLVGASAVRCAQQPAVAFSLESEHALMVRCPLGSGRAAVTVEGPGGTSALTAASEFSYPPHPTAPVVACGTGDSEWHTTNVTVACTASDQVSGLANPGDASLTLSTTVGAGESSVAAYTGGHTVCNKEGLCEEAGPVGPFKIDRKSPTIAVSPANGQLVLQGAKLAASYTCADDGSGVATCEGAIPSGQPLDTSTPGEYSFAVGATDHAGNTASRIVHYSVVEGGECGPQQLCQEGQGDTTAPKLNTISFSPASVNTANASRAVEFTVSATDDLSGAAAVQAVLTQGARTFTGLLKLSGGTALSGTWTGAVSMPQGAPQGSYEVSVSLIDAAGNSRRVSSSELLGLGQPNSVTETGGSEAVGAPPEVTGVSASPAAIETCQQAQTVTVSVGASVTPTSVGGLRVSLAGPGGQLVAGYASLESGTAHAGTWSAALTLPRYSRQGAWAISVQAWDSTYNETYLASSQLAARGYASAVQETCPGDVTAPQVAAASLTPASINTLSEARTVTVEAHATDDLSGVATLTASLSGGGHTVSAPAHLVSGTALDGQWAASLAIPRWAPQGTWTLALGTADVLGNAQSYSADQLAARGLPSSIQQTGEGDTEPPKIIGGMIVPGRIDTESEPRQVQVRLHTTDNLSGVARVIVRFVSPLKREVRAQASMEEGGTPLDGTWQANLIFPRYSDQGIWTMYVETWDTADPYALYGPSQLSAIFPQFRDAPPPKPAVSSVSPAYIKSAGGSSVTITGTGFEEVKAVTVGGQPAASYTVNSPTSITAVAPAGSGTLDVRVTNEAATSQLTSHDQTTYVATEPRPTLTKLVPNSGPIAGGTVVTLTGKYLNGLLEVLFGTLPGSGLMPTSGTSVKATTPPHALGAVEVKLTTPNGTSLVATADHFKYVPTVASVTPNTGPAAGGAVVTIKGTGFAVGTKLTVIKFGTAKSLSVNCVSSTECTAKAPAHVAGAVDVVATVSKMTSAKTTADHFAYS
jgi:hypothetical protein